MKHKSKLIKIRYPAILAACIIVFIPAAVNAQLQFDREAPPLEELLSEALENNPALESFRYRDQAIEQRIEQARAWAPPVLQYQYNPMAMGTFDADGSIDGVGYTNSSIINLSQTLPFPGKISSRMDIERARYRMSSQETAGEEIELAAVLKEYYYDLWLFQKKIEVNRELTQLLEDVIRSAERLLELDRIGLEAVLSAQTELARFRTEERILQNEYNKILAPFNQLLYREPDTPLGYIAGLPGETIPADLSTLEQQMINQRPDLQAMRYGIEMNEAEISSARRDYYPDITVGLMYMDMPVMSDRFGAMVSVQIPIAPWSSNRVSSRVREVQRQRQSREKSLENMTTMAQSGLRQSILDLETQLDVIQLYREEVIPKAEETAESVLGAFQAGRTGYLMVIDSFRRLEEFKTEYYNAQAEFHKATAEFERQIGILK